MHPTRRTTMIPVSHSEVRETARRLEQRRQLRREQREQEAARQYLENHESLGDLQGKEDDDGTD